MAAAAAPACPVVGLLALSDELLLGCCRHLGAADLARLELVAARFATETEGWLGAEPTGMTVRMPWSCSSTRIPRS